MGIEHFLIDNVFLSIGDIHHDESEITIESEPTFIELTGHTECLVRDPDGYWLAIYSR